MPGAPQNSVILPTGTPPPNMSSNFSQKVTILPADCSCCKRSKAFVLPGMELDECFPLTVGFLFQDCEESLLLRTVWTILRDSSLSIPRSNDQWEVDFFSKQCQIRNTSTYPQNKLRKQAKKTAKECQFGITPYSLQDFQLFDSKNLMVYSPFFFVNQVQEFRIRAR